MQSSNGASQRRRGCWWICRRGIDQIKPSFDFGKQARDPLTRIYTDGLPFKEGIYDTYLIYAKVPVYRFFLFAVSRFFLHLTSPSCLRLRPTHHLRCHSSRIYSECLTRFCLGSLDSLTRALSAPSTQVAEQLMSLPWTTFPSGLPKRRGSRSSRRGTTPL